MTAFSFVADGKRLTTINTTVVLCCLCGKRTTVDVLGPQQQPCQHCARIIWKQEEPE